MDISANSKEGKASAIEPSTSYIPRLHGFLAWEDDGTARSFMPWNVSILPVSFVLDCARLTVQNLVQLVDSIA